MKNLIATIGQAPSELGEMEFFIRLGKERSRVAFGFSEFKLACEKLKKKKKTKKGKGKGGKKKTSDKVFLAAQGDLFALLNDMGLSPEELSKQKEKEKHDK